MRLFREAVFVAGALALTACEAWEPGADVPGPLANTNWRLVELASADGAAPIRPGDPWKYQLSFGSDGTASARVDCNRAIGTWSTVAPPVDTLTFGPMAMTRAMCPEGSLDTRIVQELPQVRGYQRDDHQLILSLGEGRADQVWALASR